MTYLQALRILVKAYKAARGVMPKGIDLLKMKMKARQKAIDSKKVIEFPKERITDPFKARPTKGLARYEGGGEGIKKLIDKGLIRIGEVTKRKKVKEPVDPKLYQQERIKEIMKQNKEAAKRLEKKMNKEKDLGDKLKDLPDDIPDMANGGIANLTSVYNQNPSLQSQYTLDEYLDLFDTQTTTPQIQTSADILEQAQPNPINPIKPIIPLPESGGDGGEGITTIGKGRTASNQPNYMGGKEPGIVAGLQRTVGDLTTAGKEIYSLLSPIQFAKRTAKRMDAGLKAAQDYLEEKRKEKERERQRQYEAEIQNAINQGRQMQQAYEDHFSSMGYSSPEARAADTPTGTLSRI